MFQEKWQQSTASLKLIVYLWSAREREVADVGDFGVQTAREHELCSRTSTHRVFNFRVVEHRCTLHTGHRVTGWVINDLLHVDSFVELRAPSLLTPQGKRKASLPERDETMTRAVHLPILADPPGCNLIFPVNG